MYRVLSFTPATSTMTLDIVCGPKWLGQVSFICTPGKEYSYEEVKASAIEMRPSLSYKDFELVPTKQRI